MYNYDPRDWEPVSTKISELLLNAIRNLELANCIVDAIKEEFKMSHLSGNLVNTMKIIVRGADILIDIPAMKYNMKEYKRTGIIKYYYRGSYANIINDFGDHKGWVDRCLKEGISKWLAQQGQNGRISYNE